MPALRDGQPKAFVDCIIGDIYRVMDVLEHKPGRRRIALQPVMHRYSIGQLVFFEGAAQYNAARGQYKIVRLVPIERDNKVVYRIKNAAEAFERTAEEHQLRTDFA